MRPLILIGGGGHCRSVIESAESADLYIKGILDLPESVGNDISGYKVIGTDADIAAYTDCCDFIVTLGSIKNPCGRIRLHELVEKAGGRFATVVASTAHVSVHAELMPGTVVLHQAVVNAGARIGKGCIINTCANVEHDASIGDFCHVSTGAMVNGGCLLGDRSFVGSGAVIVNGLSVCADCVVGAGSIVTKNILNPGVYFGNPAKFLRK